MRFSPPSPVYSGPDDQGVASTGGMSCNRVSHSSPEAHCAFARLTTRAQFDQLEPEWNALFDKACDPAHVFQTFNWFWHWANHYLDDKIELSIITGRLNGKLVMIWPLIVTRDFGIRKLSWMGEPVGQYGNVIIDKIAQRDEIIQQAWDYIVSLPVDVAFFRNVREDSHISPHLKKISATLLASMTAHYADFADTKTVADYEGRYSAKSRSNNRRHLRRLQECGTISFEQHSEGETASQYCSRAIEMKKIWLTARKKNSPDLQDRRFESFFSDIALGKSHPCGIRVSAVLCDSKPIAIEISLKCKNHAFGHIITYDIAYAKQGLGIIMADYSIKTSFEKGFARFDLLMSDDSYKAEWSDGTVRVDNWLYPLSLRGKAYVFFRQIRKKLKSIIEPISPALAGYLARI